MTKRNEQEQEAPQAPEQDITPEQSTEHLIDVLTGQEPQAPEAPAVSLVKVQGVEALAEAVGATQKDVRRWLRAQTRAAAATPQEAAEALPGKGKRYAFTDEQVQALAALYGARKGAAGTQAPASLILAALAPAAPADADADEAPAL